MVFRKKIVVITCCCIAVIAANAQPSKMTQSQYVERYKDDAIQEMLEYGIPASITLAQGLLESSNGNSPLAIYANNHFGIKCHLDWTGETYLKDDDEKNECFRKYASVLDSYKDHVKFLKSRPRYAFLFSYKVTDYEDWAKGLKRAGYATDPRYPQRLLEIIKDNKLYEFDTIKSIPVNPDEAQPLAVAEIKTTPANATQKNNFSPSTYHNSTGTFQVLECNHLKFVIARPGDTFYRISRAYDIELPDLFRYNDLKETNVFPVLHSGDRIYIQPKRRKALEDFHTVEPGETMYSISQDYGIRLKSLYRKNRMKFGSQPIVGDKLALRHKIKL
ncbi:MAG TPA: glucosaminidase domain-containing protein [Bacteroidia bacterium]|nr:glucosaminidase domain-containing protein [Bacteroidia bacterium]